MFVSGTGPHDPVTAKIVGDTIQEQTRQCLENVSAILKAAGTSLERVAIVTVILLEEADFAGMNEEWVKWFPANPPARQGKVRYPTYYALHLPPAPALPTAAQGHVSLAIREFRSPDYLRQGPLVYRASPEQIGFYDYHRWAADPREFVTSAITDRLRAGGTFADVKVYDGRSTVDYILSGRLEKLEEVDYEGGVKVEIALSAQMIEVRTGAQVWANAVTEVGRVDQRNVPAVVSEMSNAMDRAMDKLLLSFPLSHFRIS